MEIKDEAACRYRGGDAFSTMSAWPMRPAAGACHGRAGWPAGDGDRLARSAQETAAAAGAERRTASLIGLAPPS